MSEKMIEESGLREGYKPRRSRGDYLSQREGFCIISERTAWDTRKLVFCS